eukprot:5993098-Prymnesium_polylepis.1
MEARLKGDHGPMCEGETCDPFCSCACGMAASRSSITPVRQLPAIGWVVTDKCEATRPPVLAPLRNPIYAWNTEYGWQEAFKDGESPSAPSPKRVRSLFQATLSGPAAAIYCDDVSHSFCAPLQCATAAAWTPRRNGSRDCRLSTPIGTIPSTARPVATTRPPGEVVPAANAATVAAAIVAAADIAAADDAVVAATPTTVVPASVAAGAAVAAAATLA